MIANRGAMVALDRIARRYGSRPSALVGEADEMMAWTIDYWATSWGAQQDAIDVQKAKTRAGRG